MIAVLLRRHDNVLAKFFRAPLFPYCRLLLSVLRVRFAGRERRNRQGMDRSGQLVTQGAIDKTLARHPRLSLEGRGDDCHTKMALTAFRCRCMSRMQMRLVDDLQLRR